MIDQFKVNSLVTLDHINIDEYDTIPTFEAYEIGFNVEYKYLWFLAGTKNLPNWCISLHLPGITHATGGFVKIKGLRDTYIFLFNGDYDDPINYNGKHHPWFRCLSPHFNDWKLLANNFPIDNSPRT